MVFWTFVFTKFVSASTPWNIFWGCLGALCILYGIIRIAWKPKIENLPPADGQEQQQPEEVFDYNNSDHLPESLKELRLCIELPVRLEGHRTYLPIVLTVLQCSGNLLLTSLAFFSESGAYSFVAAGLLVFIGVIRFTVIAYETYQQRTSCSTLSVKLQLVGLNPYIEMSRNLGIVVISILALAGQDKPLVIATIVYFSASFLLASWQLCKPVFEIFYIKSESIPAQ